MTSATVQALADRAEIHDALMRYCRGVDRCDEAMVRSAFHEDSSDDHGYWRGNGWEFASFIVGNIRERALRTTHAVANVLIELDDDRAFVESYVFAYLWRESGDGEALDLFAGRYVDRFERRDGSWRIARRRVVHDWSARPRVGASGLGLALEALVQGVRGPGDASYER